MNWEEDSWIHMNNGLYRLKTAHSIKFTLKYYPDMGQ